MNPALGWALAGAALVAGWFSYRWQGLALAFTLVVFWLLIQFNRSVRVMRDAAGAPIGQVASAVMLLAKLRPGLPMLQVVTLGKSLGRHVSAAPETWSWSDASGAELRIVFAKGRCVSWVLTRPDQSENQPADGAPNDVAA